MTRKELRIWLLLTGLVFVVVGFYDFIPSVGPAGLQYWGCCRLFWNSLSHRGASFNFAFLAVFTICLLVLSAAIAALCQASFIVCYRILRFVMGVRRASLEDIEIGGSVDEHRHLTKPPDTSIKKIDDSY